MRPEKKNVETRAGTLRVHVWTPAVQVAALTVVTVHPWAPLGGGEHNTQGIAKAQAEAGVRSVSFEMSSSSMVWGVLSNHNREVHQIVDICRWSQDTWPENGVLLFGSSAGSPQAGSALAQSEDVVGLACVGYTWGWLSSIAFGRHFGAFLHSSKPKLLITGDRDEFTPLATLEKMVGKAQAGTIESRVVSGVGHFELEMPHYDSQIARWVLEWMAKHGWLPAAGAGAAAARAGESECADGPL